MRTAILVSLLSLLVSNASAECNNMCSGHGMCGANDMCTCFRNWRGNDCSEQSCQYGIAFIDTPQGDLNHNGVIDMPPAPTSSSQTLTLTSNSNLANGDSFYLQYVDSAGVLWQSGSITSDALILNIAAGVGSGISIAFTSAVNGYANPDFSAATIAVGGCSTVTLTTTCTIDIAPQTSTSMDNTNLLTIYQPSNPNHVMSMTRVNSGWSNLVVTQWASKGTWEGYNKFKPDQAHAYMECSNKGLCDRSTGECVCFDGYEGSACQRTVCPNACSGNGVCRNIVDKSNALSSSARESYPLWDGLKNQACVCDPGFSGIDCSQRLCPRNADPLLDAAVYETQTLHYVGDGVVSLQYTDSFGEVWQTTPIQVATALDMTAVCAALSGIPNSVIQSPLCTRNNGDAQDVDIYFRNNAGDLQLLVSSATSVATVAEKVKGTNLNEECSFRGVCQYDTGLCKCFRGYRTDDCHLQHALAY